MNHSLKPLETGGYICIFCQHIVTELNQPKTDDDWRCKPPTQIPGSEPYLPGYWADFDWKKE